MAVSLPTPTESEQVTVRAQARFVRTSARKARVVLEHVRGRTYAQAHAALTFSPRAASRDILRVLESAAANAAANQGLDTDELVVHACYADEGPTAKRFQPRARGRAFQIKKRYCHITIVLRAVERPEGAAESAPTATAESARRRRVRASRAAAAAPGTEAIVEAPVEETAEAPAPAGPESEA